MYIQHMSTCTYWHILPCIVWTFCILSCIVCTFCIVTLSVCTFSHFDKYCVYILIFWHAFWHVVYMYILTSFVYNVFAYWHIWNVHFHVMQYNVSTFWYFDMYCLYITYSTCEIKTRICKNRDLWAGFENENRNFGTRGRVEETEREQGLCVYQSVIHIYTTHIYTYI